MEEEKTTIRAVVRALEGRQALVEVESGGCGRCHEKGGCGGQHLTQMFCSSPKTYLADNDFSAQIGDRVTVAIAAGAVRQTANLVYGVPLTATLAGAVLGMPLGGDLAAMQGAALGLVLAVAYVRFSARNLAGKTTARPHIISRC
jgi:sigma-E factor negative regulatory protein RseC